MSKREVFEQSNTIGKDLGLGLRCVYGGKRYQVLSHAIRRRLSKRKNENCEKILDKNLVKTTTTKVEKTTQNNATLKAQRRNAIPSPPLPFTSIQPN